MDYAMVVEVGNSGEGCADKVCGVGFVVTAFSTYSVEQFTTEGKIGYQVYCRGGGSTSQPL